MVKRLNQRLVPAFEYLKSIGLIAEYNDGIHHHIPTASYIFNLAFDISKLPEEEQQTAKTMLKDLSNYPINELAPTQFVYREVYQTAFDYIKTYLAESGKDYLSFDDIEVISNYFYQDQKLLLKSQKSMLFFLF